MERGGVGERADLGEGEAGPGWPPSCGDLSGRNGERTLCVKTLSSVPDFKDCFIVLLECFNPYLFTIIG